MSSENLACDVVAMQQAYLIRELSRQSYEYISHHRAALQHFEKALVQQELHLYQKMPIVSTYYWGMGLYILLGEEFEQAGASIWILTSGYAVVSENGSLNRYYQFKSAHKNEALSQNTQMNVVCKPKEQLDREITMLKEKLSLYEQHGVQAQVIDDELVIRRLNKQIP